jgi:hypothetical protein
VQININCPANGIKINVNSGSGSGGTICVLGTVTWDDDRPLEADRYFVAIYVYDCTTSPGGMCPAAPSTPPSGYTSTSISGDQWYAQSVNVPSFTSGDSMIVYAWLMVNAGSGVSAATVPAGQQFNLYVGNPSASTCCSSGTETAGANIFSMLAELRSDAKLQVTIPEGKHAGHILANPAGYLQWRFRFDHEDFMLAYCPTDGLVIRSKSKSAAAKSIEAEPFSALFSGKIFGMVEDIAVTIA